VFSIVEFDDLHTSGSIHVKITELTLSQFRCWDYKELTFPGDLIYLKGPNGCGKTSVLEAISYLSTGRSFRTSRDQECVQYEQSTFSLRGRFSEAEVSTISMEYRSEVATSSKKRFQIDGDPVQRLSQLRQSVASVLFSSSDLKTFREGPSLRRQFLNDILSRTKPSYLDRLKNYEKALKQRNSLLKEPSPDPVLLDTVEETLAENGEHVIRARMNFWPDIQSELQEKYRQLEPGPDRRIEVQFQTNVDSVEHFVDELKQERDRAMERGYTTIGPHRDDWEFMVDGHSTGDFFSQGELRTLAFALKFTISEYIMNEVNKRALLLFDDMMSDLDQRRISICLNYARETPFQLIFTGTRPLVDRSHMDDEHRITLERGLT